MICGYKFCKHAVVLYVRFAGSHQEYDGINPCLINMF
ncbi:MAG: hypothetical protein GC181_16365 [Bacteroidetes bacterium]|nr:hypothetical protein [Bacteroidota bacterium]